MTKFASLSITLVSTLLLVACSGGPQAALPLAPSALPSSTLALEAADGIDAWGTLGKGNDKGKDDKGKGKDADDVDSDDDADSDSPVATTTVKIEGVISAATGDCPARTFVVGLQSVMTDAATKYEGGLCAQLVREAAVEVRAVRRADGTLVAKDVEFDDADVDDDEDDTEDDDGDGTPHHGAGPHDGTVSSFRGVCPTVTFNLKGLTIVADAKTTYVGGNCATLRPNVQVVVTGALAPAARRTFNAATITITRTH